MRLLSLFFLATVSVFAQASALQIPIPRWQPLDSNGRIVPFGKICTYATGTFTPLATYTDNTATVALSNPVVLDASGRANIWFKAGSYYRIVFQQPGDANCPGTGASIWTQDGVPPSSISNLSAPYIVPVISPTTPGVLIPSLMSCDPTGCAVTGSGLFNVGEVFQVGFNPSGGTDELQLLNTSGNAYLFAYSTAGTSATIGAGNGMVGGLPLILNPASDNVVIGGNGLLLSLGTYYRCTHGTNATCGTVFLSGGTATVATTSIGPLAAPGAAGWAISLTYNTCVSCAALSVGATTTGVSFVINSSDAGDASLVFWESKHIE